MDKMDQNTGKKIYRWLKEIDANTGQPTGNRKLNLPQDPDYVAPVEDLLYCPLPSDQDISVIINWNDKNSPNNIYSDRFMGDKKYNYEIFINIENQNPNLEISFIKVFMSGDEGSSWGEISYENNLIKDSLGDFDKKWYRVVVEDNFGKKITSNILKVLIIKIGVGRVVMVYNQIESDPLNAIPIVLEKDKNEEIVILFRNKSESQIVRLIDFNPVKLTGSACRFDKSNGEIVEGIYEVRPMIGNLIAMNNGWVALRTQDMLPGLYILKLSVENPNYSINKTVLKNYIYYWSVIVQ